MAANLNRGSLRLLWVDRLTTGHLAAVNIRSEGVDHYRVYRRDHVGGPWLLITDDMDAAQCVDWYQHRAAESAASASLCALLDSDVARLLEATS